ncbi:hypothetical protein COW36_02075 [bacterium (Candidatus Blackallbacteria) CG17_big_fil_post_rev_8_21_14_2_50_48_46]|uniref:Uncharacterized protein n=1 Tax=bacterium (Candidatus Blackallbacteria) CG17_big_fil_post_rev_8_21_14_2_50_48_46 TaxID=2014261 RepID=A0A2M7GAN9_9BACT|nr:MAG: hypothetical protein COW36_02075 [bacterium (Candidatus Blackallbacteria) CG17_big_fil_post_rev_8_21_14_2_50_48_46]
MQVRSLLGKTYDNRNSAARNYLFYTNQTQTFATATGPVRLGKDGLLYFESLEISQGSTHRVYYRLGKFNPLPPVPSEGTAIAFQLDPGVSLKMDWRGINPMNHDELHWSIPPAVQAQSLSSDLFL